MTSIAFKQQKLKRISIKTGNNFRLDVGEVFETLSRCPLLEAVDINSFSILWGFPETLKYLPELLHLKKLSLKFPDDIINDSVYDNFLGKIKKMEWLQLLKLDFFSTGDNSRTLTKNLRIDCLKAIADGTLKNLKTLVLNIGSLINSIDTHYDFSQMKDNLLEYFQIEFPFSNIEDNEVCSIFGFLSRCSQLKRLKINAEGNNLSDNAFLSLNNVSFRNLKELNFNFAGNDLQYLSAKNISRIIYDQRILKFLTLYLNGNEYFDNDCVDEIFDGFYHKSCLEILHLRIYINENKGRLKSINELIEEMPALEKIIIKIYGKPDKFVKELFQACENHPSLKQISYHNFSNTMDKKTKDYLYNYLQSSNIHIEFLGYGWQGHSTDYQTQKDINQRTKKKRAEIIINLNSVTLILFFICLLAIHLIYIILQLLSCFPYGILQNKFFNQFLYHHAAYKQ